MCFSLVLVRLLVFCRRRNENSQLFFFSLPFSNTANTTFKEESRQQRRTLIYFNFLCFT